MMQVKFAVIGAGVVGLACAARLAKVGPTVLLERRPKIGEETSSRNSEVIHAGIYYPLDSLKMEMCIKGKKMLYQVAEKYNLPYKRCTKWLISQNDADYEYLSNVKKKVATLGVPLEWMPRSQIAEEPNVIAKDVLLSPTTGIIDSHELMSFLETKLIERGSMLALNTEVKRIEKKSGGYLLETGPEECTIEAEAVVNSAGLYGTEIAKMILGDKTPKNYTTYFCKGHYFGYSGSPLVKRLIYPVPEKNLTGLGVHATVDLAGRMRFGPDTLYISDPTDYHVDESRLDQVFASVTKYLRGVSREKLYSDYAGIRPKLSRAGEPARDFLIKEESDKGYPGFINLLGIESPGLTSSLAIADKVAELLRLSKEEEF